MNSMAVSFLKSSQLVLMRVTAGSVALVAAAGFAQAQSLEETVLYSFQGGIDGAIPSAALIFDSNGALYGTTPQGGTAGQGTLGQGTVFKLTPPASGPMRWTETVLYRFSGGADGSQPYDGAGLIFDSSGALYGTARSGGTALNGTVFKLTPPANGQTQWTETVLHNFPGGTDGGNPYAGLIFDSNGALYGTTTETFLQGVTSSHGTVYKLMPPAGGGTPWTKTVLYSFQGGSDGSIPFAGLIFDSNGALYGTTIVGGTAGFGTVYKLTPPAGGGTPWTETVLYSFTGTDGNEPVAGLIFDSNGALYGTTYYGGTAGQGTVYKLTPPAGGGTPWTETVLHSFSGGHDGVNPQAGLIFDTRGAVYGTTYLGGLYGFGTVYKLTPPAVGQTQWTETVLHSFKSFKGTTGSSQPLAGVIFDSNGALYGTTAFGGISGQGTVFKLTGK